MYGLIDIGLYIFCIVMLARARNLAKHEFLWTGLAIYTPNVLLFLINVFSWGHFTLNLYQGWLRFKLLVQGFVLPLAIIQYDEISLNAYVCSRMINIPGMTEAKM